MLSDDLFQQVLMAPAEQEGVNCLRIVSGFATANMAGKHMGRLHESGKQIDIELIVGMHQNTGIQKAQHLAFQKLTRETAYSGLNFSCRYVVQGVPVHAKTYCWMAGGQPVQAFAGSANYSERAFGKKQIEIMDEVDCNAAAAFFARIDPLSADCAGEDIENFITIHETYWPADSAQSEYELVHLPLLDKQTRETPARSGINWGQRPGRNPNQAYIHIPAPVRESGFFPARYEQFTVETDDGHSFIMVRAQDYGKGLHTTQNNALLGEYLRRRIGGEKMLGKFVTRQHLLDYGRTTVTFAKIEDETYSMDFRPNVGPADDG